MNITPGDLGDARVQALLALHLAAMNANSPPGHVQALDVSGLQRDDIAFFTAWDGENLLGCGALRALSENSGEIKSMRTAPRHLRKGVAVAILGHLLGIARARGYGRVSLETGSGPAFEPALALYRRAGFRSGPAFGDYEASAFNQFFHLDIAAS